MRMDIKFMAIAAGMLTSMQVHALSLGFSSTTSDLTDPDLLDATMDLDVTANGADSGGDLLTITLDNMSDTTGLPDDPDNGFTLSEAYFNFSGSHSLFALDPASQGDASLSFDTNADGFGRYDVKLDLGAGNAGLAPGDSDSWTIDLGDTGFTDTDFEEWSSIPPGETQAIAALFFSKGPCDPEITSCVEDSAFSIPGTSDGTLPPSSIPVPAAIWLFSSGLFGLVMAARRRAG